MDRSFFYKSDADVAAGSANFLAKITAAPTAYGLVAAQATAYGTVDAAYQTAYTTAVNPDTRTKSSVAAKNAAKAALRVMAADLARIINGTSTVTDAQKIDLGLAVRVGPTPVPVPSVRPAMDVESVNGRTVIVHVHDSASSSRRGKPAGCRSAWVYSFIGNEYPSDPSAWTFEGGSTRGKFTIVFPSTVAGGTQVWLCAAWVNNKDQAGPVSIPVSTYLQGGGSSETTTLKVAA